MSAYSERVLDHFRNPRNQGVLEDANAVGMAGNPQCGDTMKLYLKVRDGRIEDVRWQTLGCGASIAASSAASELLKGATVEQARKLTRQRIAEAVGGLPEGKVHCSVLAADALKAALEDYEGRAMPAVGTAR